MKKLSAILLATLLLFCLTACRSEEDKKIDVEPETEAPVSTSAPEKELAIPHKAPTEAAAAPTGSPVLVLNATVNGETSLSAESGTPLTAEAVLPEGMAVDCWVLNGQPQPDASGDSFSFTPEGQTVVEARLRPEYTVSAIHADIQFLNGNHAAAGEKFTEFVFEEDYVNPVTGEQIPGGTVSFFVKARIPKGSDIEYWLINGVPYYFTNYVNGFRVMDLNESRVYEPVFYGIQPQQPTVPRPADPTVPPATDPPVTYYTVTCQNCCFSGGGTGGESGQVPAGTVITVTSYEDYIYWEGSYVTNWNQCAATSFSYTVNSDCFFRALAVIN